MISFLLGCGEFLFTTFSIKVYEINESHFFSWLCFCSKLMISADRLERTNSYPNEGEKNQTTAPKNAPLLNFGDVGSSNRLNENYLGRLIPLHGCGNSEAFQLLNDRKLTFSLFPFI